MVYRQVSKCSPEREIINVVQVKKGELPPIAASATPQAAPALAPCPMSPNNFGFFGGNKPLGIMTSIINFIKKN